MNKGKVRKSIFEIFIFIISLTYIVPAWMVIINSLKTRRDAAFFGIGISGRLHFENYIKVFQEANILRALLNGLFLAGVVCILSVILTSMGSFAIARIKNRFTEFSYYLFLSGIIIPGAVIPTYFILHYMHLTNTYIGLILVFTASTNPLNVFLYSGFIKTVPKELDEAGIIDGCGKLRLFFRIVFPLLKPATIAVFIFNFMGVWNDVQTQLYFATQDKWTMPMMVYRFSGMYSTDWNLVFADLFLTSIPVILVYILGQKYMVSGLTAGSVKG